MLFFTIIIIILFSSIVLSLVKLTTRDTTHKDIITPPPSPSPHPPPSPSPHPSPSPPPPSPPPSPLKYQSPLSNTKKKCPFTISKKNPKIDYTTIINDISKGDPYLSTYLGYVPYQNKQNKDLLFTNTQIINPMDNTFHSSFIKVICDDNILVSGDNNGVSVARLYDSNGNIVWNYFDVSIKNCSNGNQIFQSSFLSAAELNGVIILAGICDRKYTKTDNARSEYCNTIGTDTPTLENPELYLVKLTLDPNTGKIDDDKIKKYIFKPNVTINDIIYTYGGIYSIDSDALGNCFIFGGKMTSPDDPHLPEESWHSSGTLDTNGLSMFGKFTLYGDDSKDDSNNIIPPNLKISALTQDICLDSTTCGDGWGNDSGNPIGSGILAIRVEQKNVALALIYKNDPGLNNAAYLIRIDYTKDIKINWLLKLQNMSGQVSDFNIIYNEDNTPKGYAILNARGIQIEDKNDKNDKKDRNIVTLYDIYNNDSSNFINIKSRNTPFKILDDNSKQNSFPEKAVVECWGINSYNDNMYIACGSSVNKSGDSDDGWWTGIQSKVNFSNPGDIITKSFSYLNKNDDGSYSGRNTASEYLAVNSNNNTINAIDADGVGIIAFNN